MRPKIFIDGHVGTTGLRVREWLADRRDLELVALDESERKRESARRDLLNARGEPEFQVVMYALRKDGAYGAAAMHPGKTFAIHDGTEARALPCATLFE